MTLIYDRNILIILILTLCIGKFVHGASMGKPCTLKDSTGFQISDIDLENSIPSGKQFRIQCLEESKNLESGEIGLICFNGIIVQNETGIEFSLENFECFNNFRVSKAKTTTLIRNGTCQQNATNVDVYIDKSRPFYSVCFDERTSTTLYSHSSIDGEALANEDIEGGSSRKNFKNAGFFPFDVRLAYTRAQQEETLSNLLGSSEMFQKYFPNNIYFLSRGHLFPRADSLQNIEREATFFFINAVPQFQILNAGNWGRVEDSVRNVAKELESELQIWTGTYEVLKLKDIHDKDVELHLGLENDEIEETVKRLPVPKFFWKVVFSESEHAAVAFVQINNPWFEFTKEDLLCDDICDQINWLTLSKTQRKNPTKGFTYCCDPNSLQQKIKIIPKLKYSKVLNPETSTEEISSDDGKHRTNCEKKKENVYTSLESNEKGQSET